ncbi:aminoglycoside phosphotransferase family protein [Pseudarthrobacter sp. So.54]
MSQCDDVPIPPELRRHLAGSTGGRGWLAALPRLIQQTLDQWDLRPDLASGALPWNGHGAIVIPVRPRTPPWAATGESGVAAGDAAVLKIAYPYDEALVEPHALTLWKGDGAVRLLAADAAAGALLLERLDAARSLQDEPMDVAVPVWGGLVRRLSRVPDDAPEWRELDHVAARAERWSDELPETWDRLGRPFPRWLLEAALEVCQTRGAVGRRSGRDVLVHTDLHYSNVLARPGRHAPAKRPASALRRAAGNAAENAALDPADGWAAIDPQPLIGEAEFAVAPLLWNRIRELPGADPERGLLERCRDFSLAAGLDSEAARQWSVAREVDNALDYAATPRHEGDLARSLWVASTLAGRTLPGLPAPGQLPAPGEARS